jgi:hypothetical protein
MLCVVSFESLPRASLPPDAIRSSMHAALKLTTNAITLVCSENFNYCSTVVLVGYFLNC